MPPRPVRDWILIATLVACLIAMAAHAGSIAGDWLWRLIAG